jgi:glycosyltransferase involved in cell wall biosynthesis
MEGRYSAGEASLYADAKKEDMVADFAEKILWLLDHPEERMRMGKTGRTRVEQQLAWKFSVENLVAAYDRAFAKKGRLAAHKVAARISENQ